MSSVFSLYRRRSIVYVRFLNDTGKYSNGISTGKRNGNAASRVVADWLANGLPGTKDQDRRPVSEAFDASSFLNLARAIALFYLSFCSETIRPTGNPSIFFSRAYFSIVSLYPISLSVIFVSKFVIAPENSGLLQHEESVAVALRMPPEHLGLDLAVGVDCFCLG